MTLTNRLSLFFLTMLAIVLFGFSATLFLFVRSHLHRQSEERLDAALNALIASIEIGPDGLLEWEPAQRHLKLGPAAFGDQVLWLVNDDQGEIVDRSRQAHAEEFLAEASERLRASQRSTKRLDWQGEHWEFGQRWIQPEKRESIIPDAKDANQKSDEKKYLALSITAGIPLDSDRATLHKLAATLAGLSLAIWLLAMFAGRAMCRRALLPVTRMAASAGEIDANNLEQRLPAVTSGDELEDLQRAFNGMLDRLQNSFERQRRFTGDASHQLRTPIAVILGQIEVALRRQRSPEEYQRVLTTVGQKADHLRQMVEALLFLARSDHDAPLPDRERVDLRTWLSDQLQQWSERDRAKDIVLEAASDDSCVVAVQPALLGELLHILIDNACKFSPTGTPITIRLCREGQAVCIQVEDKGSGIADSDLPHLFTPFFRSADSRRLGIDGNGLGLSIARRLAGALGSELTVTSHIGSGSCFMLRLPSGGRNGTTIRDEMRPCDTATAANPMTE